MQRANTPDPARDPGTHRGNHDHALPAAAIMPRLGGRESADGAGVKETRKMEPPSGLGS